MGFPAHRGWKSRAGILPARWNSLRRLFPPCPDRLEALSYVISVHQRSSAVKNLCDPLRSRRLCVENEFGSAGQADFEIGAPIWIRDRLEALFYVISGHQRLRYLMNLVRQKTCKTLLQVKQSFVIHLALQAATRLPLACQRRLVLVHAPPHLRLRPATA